MNVAVQALPPYAVTRIKPNILNAEEASWELPTMQVVERGVTRLALLTLAVSV